MKLLAFDIEYHPGRKTITSYGTFDLEANLHKGSNVPELIGKLESADVILGHNIIHHDLRILNERYGFKPNGKPTIDTLFLSSLLFANKPYHKLTKKYFSSLNIEEVSNPALDSKLSMELYHDLVSKWESLNPKLQVAYFHLLGEHPGFAGFFTANGHPQKNKASNSITKRLLHGKVCSTVDIGHLITTNPLELAYAIALINAQNEDSILPGWLIHTYPKILEILSKLRLVYCGKDSCQYCQQYLSPISGLRKYFGYPGYRKFEGDQDVPLQQAIVDSGLLRESLLAVLPTGGGKSICYQVPALMAHELKRSLTVIISPLQSLMKDQVDNLIGKGIFKAFTINGMIDPVTRAKAVEAVEMGSAAMLYISPESLRSKTIRRILLGRDIERFVIDEAHCFSAWGHDFRPDYFYIAEFIRDIQERQAWNRHIPVSCFTATAKPEVIRDITAYFSARLSQSLDVFITHAKRPNLTFGVAEAGDDDKFERLLNLLDLAKGPTIIYAARVKRCEEIAERLNRFQKPALFYHGQMEPDQKRLNQEKFMEGEVDIMVATSAFGMGVDKSNITNVIHYEISPSLENYIQEAGRAGRDQEIQAKCHVLFNEEDLQKHFNLLNSTRLNKQDISQIWRAVRLFKRERFSKSALEIAEKAGWDLEMNELETKVKTAIANLEEVGFLKREENATRLFAQNILVKNFDRAREIITERLGTQNPKVIQTPVRIMQYLISRDKTQVDLIAYHLGLTRYEVGGWINKFKDWNLLGDSIELEARISIVQSKNSSARKLEKCLGIEKELIRFFKSQSRDSSKIYLKDLHDQIDHPDKDAVSFVILERLINFWELNRKIRKKSTGLDRHVVHVNFSSEKALEAIKRRNELSKKILDVIVANFVEDEDTELKIAKAVFTIKQIREALRPLIESEVSTTEIEEALYFMIMLEIISVEGGLIVFYNPMKITRLEETNKQYTKEEYQQLERFYQSRTEQVHIVGEYAKKMLRSSLEGMQFVDDYFQLEYQVFLEKYFRGKLGKIKRPVTEANFRKIVGDLSIEQTNIIRDNQSNRILIAAGPGSGKTRVLVHKVASLMMMEDVKQDQFLMLTFSRPAAQEMRSRLKNLIGTVYGLDISTFHSYAFDLIGQKGDLERSGGVIRKAIDQLREESQYYPRIAQKSVILVDEYQDIDRDQYDFIREIVRIAENARVIVVGDDDQNIYSFRGSSTKFMLDFMQEFECRTYYLTKNYRSRANLVDFCDDFISAAPIERVKSGIKMQPNDQRKGPLELYLFPGDSHPVEALVDALKKLKTSGGTCILTRTNEESLQVKAFLDKAGIEANLVMDRSGYRVRSMLEMEVFSHWIERNADEETGRISRETFAELSDKLADQYQNSRHIERVTYAIGNFYNAKRHIFRSDWRRYLEELRHEDLVSDPKNKVWVSTMHKVKGREFRHVFLYLDHFQLKDHDDYRLFYVAASRAMQSLRIFTNNHTLIKYLQGHGEIYQSDIVYPIPSTIRIFLTLEDIYLDKAKNRPLQKALSDTKGQLEISYDPTEKNVRIGSGILHLSKKGKAKITQWEAKDYKVQSTELDQVVIWRDEKEEYRKGYRIPLCLVSMEKKLE